MISEQFMQLGRWDLRLSPDTPASIRQFINPGDQIVITPTRVPFGGYPAHDFATITSGYEAQIASLLEAARFRGPILEVGEKKTALGGHGLLWYLGNGNGDGMFTDWTVSPKTWTLHMLDIANQPDSPYSGFGGLTHSGTSLPSTTWPASGESADELPRNVLERLIYLAGVLDVEFYVTPTGLLRTCGSSAWFVTTPQVILQSGHEGRDLDLIGLRLVSMERTEDYWTTTGGAFVYGAGGGSASSFNINLVLYGADGGDYDYAHLEELGSADSGDPSSLGLRAAVLADQYNASNNVISASIDAYDPGRWMKPGDYLWAYDPLSEVYDDGQATTYQGQHITPAKLRLYGMDWSVREGMGVYRIPADHGGSAGRYPPVLDITEYVEYEDSPCRLDLGAWRRPYND